ncbi:hypothetical protein KGM_207087 [Danaus plexippus plexippus]|uniref:RRM domain-containing protein n=1 Tax=Danaus plexippus plexippus TaxID=278856 RepID=A0A212FMS8_DANPL|nr:hypothetical protein KGM_207087 [Danaus plexippus plexippus]
MSVIIRLQNLPWSANALDIRNYFRGLSIPEGGVHIVGGELGDAFIAFRSAITFTRSTVSHRHNKAFVLTRPKNENKTLSRTQSYNGMRSACRPRQDTMVHRYRFP